MTVPVSSALNIVPSEDLQRIYDFMHDTRAMLIQYKQENEALKLEKRRYTISQLAEHWGCGVDAARKRVEAAAKYLKIVPIRFVGDKRNDTYTGTDLVRIEDLYRKGVKL
ncbi:MAG: hypothetical protein KF870_07385 [Leadbetterella sp.]|nr:hypothetical protein [Leadbetterella sp.]